MPPTNLADELRGAWRVVRRTFSGVESPPDEDGHFLWFTEGVIITGNEWAAWDMPYTVHADTEPAGIDIRRDDTAAPWDQPAILEVAGDTLRICGAGSPGRPRPRAFTSTPADEQDLYVAVRCDEPLPET